MEWFRFYSVSVNWINALKIQIKNVNFVKIHQCFIDLLSTDPPNFTCNRGNCFLLLKTSIYNAYLYSRIVYNYMLELRCLNNMSNVKFMFYLLVLLLITKVYHRKLKRCIQSTYINTKSDFASNVNCEYLIVKKNVHFL